MKPYQYEFIEFCLRQQVLQFGNFTLKSGRQSPYFFNAGLFNTGNALAKLGFFYTQCILENQISFELIFGPAYKGIPIVTSTAIALTQFGKDIAFAFNRKEAKTHGEKGNIIGHPVEGKRILILDDVITAGTAIKETIELLANYEATLAGVVIALDRQEQRQEKIGIPIISIINFDMLMVYIKENKTYPKTILLNMLKHQEKYC